MSKRSKSFFVKRYSYIAVTNDVSIKISKYNVYFVKNLHFPRLRHSFYFNFSVTIDVQ